MGDAPRDETGKKISRSPLRASLGPPEFWQWDTAGGGNEMGYLEPLLGVLGSAPMTTYHFYQFASHL